MVIALYSCGLYSHGPYSMAYIVMAYVVMAHMMMADAHTQLLGGCLSRGQSLPRRPSSLLPKHRLKGVKVP